MGTYYLQMILQLSMNLPREKRVPFQNMLDKFESMTQQELETLINEINDYWKKSLLARADSEDEKRYRRLFPVFNTEFKTKFPTLTVLLNTK
jgi:hypothetical protein